MNETIESIKRVDSVIKNRREPSVDINHKINVLSNDMNTLKFRMSDLIKTVGELKDEIRRLRRNG